MYITDIYLPCSDTETGDFRFLPFPGSTLDQPYMSMQVIKIIQGVYRKFLVDKQKQMMAGQKSRRR